MLRSSCGHFTYVEPAARGVPTPEALLSASYRLTKIRQRLPQMAPTFKGRIRLPVQLLHESGARDALRAVHLLPTLPRVQSSARAGISSVARGGGTCRHHQSSGGHVAHRCSKIKAKINVLTSMLLSNAVLRWHTTPRRSDVTLHTSEAAREVQQHDPRRVVHGPLRIVYVPHSIATVVRRCSQETQTERLN